MWTSNNQIANQNKGRLKRYLGKIDFSRRFNKDSETPYSLLPDFKNHEIFVQNPIMKNILKLRNHNQTIKN
ncbi:hypothetical protein EUTSA_v10009272mg [Eutrema salsugineum]|uniref:Uncharacterized protein n=1 Tax=Eutrema salsugineum TaxID=72664 RepID=V4KWA7_EUTSA|nr:hypothetical protein EUTSA_v10009272mg [Eutrema salsugineum]